ncbi:MAG: DNA methyltransferase [Lachnospiraceae bacterium]|nr:DNA methyltransferase [Lachnospiraceae bacterium]
MDSKEELRDLIAKYQQYKIDKKSVELSEEETRSWINRLLEIFGWDVLNTQQIKQEKIVDEEQKTKLAEIDSTHTKPDYSLVNGNTVKAYLDAKKIDVDIFKSKDAAFQVRSYGWSADLPCSFLTNFEQFVIFDCRFAPKKSDPATTGAIQISMDEYIGQFEQLENHLNRVLVYHNNLKKLYDTTNIEGTHTVDELFNELLTDFRLQLANNMYQNNKTSLSEDELNYYVQIILDRIIFIRVCESKGLEKEGLLLDFLKKGFWNVFKTSCYAEFYNHYDGAMFEKDVNNKFPNIALDDEIFDDFVKQLYYPYPYKFNAIPTKVIAKVYEDFLAYSLSIKNDSVVSCLKEEYVKTNGAIPTHEFIADAICKQTLSTVNINSPEDIFAIRILDPCCGSGVFLVSAYEYLSNRLRDITTKTNRWCIVDGDNKYLTVAAKQEIMKNCLYGIDCDPTAAEVTKMSMALKVIDDINEVLLTEAGMFGEKILSDIHKNIVTGNTLVDIDIECPPSEIKYIRPLNIKGSVYKNVFDEKGGFDYVLGNPPYVETKHFKAASTKIHEYLHNNYSTFEGKVDLSVLFIERTMDLLNNNGYLGMIIQRRWFKTNYGKGARKFITQGSHLHKLLDIETNSLFKGRTTYVSVIILTKGVCNEVEYDLIKGDVNDVQLYFDEDISPEIIDSSYFSEAIWAPELKTIFEIKNKYAQRYGTVGTNTEISVCDGTQALWKKVYDIVEYSENNGIITGKNGFKETVSIEKEMVKPIIYNREFKPLKDLIPDAYRVFPYEGTGNKTKISIKTVKNDYPLAYKYLSKNKKRIKAQVKCNAGDYWHTYTREHNHDSFDSAKIIIPMTTKETYATFENKQGLYMDNSNVWFINYKGDNALIMKALTMIINSTIFSVFAKCGANQASNGYYKFNKQFIEPVPLPNNKIKASNKIIKSLSSLYEDMKALLSEYEKATVNDKLLYKGVMESKWKEVDDLCYELYGVDAREKNLIEGIGRIESRIPGGDED